MVIMQALRMKRPTGQANGFTLIELIVVMTLIALLLTIAVPRYFKVVDGGKLKVQHQNIAVMRDALDKYNADQGRYPDRLQDLVEKRYLREIPIDPVSDSYDWVVVAPPNERGGAVYDVLAPAAVNGPGNPQAAQAVPDGPPSGDPGSVTLMPDAAPAEAAPAPAPAPGG
jgi:general secretion pathway protein G